MTVTVTSETVYAALLETGLKVTSETVYAAILPARIEVASQTVYAALLADPSPPSGARRRQAVMVN